MTGTHILSKQNTFATILDAILDFSVCHLLYQFMLAVSDTTDHAEHFGIWHFLQKEKIWFSKVLASPGTLKSDLMGA